MCLAGRGVGISVKKLIPAVVDCINSGELCILTCALNSVSNHHVRLLQNRLPTSVFEERVRVVGARGRDALSKSMMLEALTWKLMKPAVEQYERRMVPLRNAMRDELADFCLVFLIMYSKNSEQSVGEVMGI